MLDRIERVTRVKGVEPDVRKSFKRKEGFEDQGKKKQQFSQVLDRELSKESRPGNDAGPGAPRAYALELARPTHSLYYENEVDFAQVKRNLLKR
jgi:hypothetical protein